MRTTNFETGRHNAGFVTNYRRQFEGKSNDSTIIIDKAEKNKLESSHWDHSRSWSQNFGTE